jgi:hypothetical protein
MRRKPGEHGGTHLRLTEIEKLDGQYTGLAFTVRCWFDQGKTLDQIPELLQGRFGVTVTRGMVESFRCTRWVPEKEAIAERIATTQAAIEAFGGDVGVDALLLAKLWELMDKLSAPQLISARSLFVKIRAQNLKEQEFLYKTGQWKPSHAEGDAPDPETQQRNVLHRIKEIFGLAGHGEEDAPTPQLPAVGSV